MPNFTGYPADTSKTNATLMQDDHPNHHDVLGGAVNFLQGLANTAAANIGALQSSVTSIGSQITALQAEDMSLQSQIDAIGTSGSDATAVAAALAAHVANTGPVHGIADTAKIITSSNDTIDDEIVLTRSAFNALSGSYVTGRMYVVRP